MFLADAEALERESSASRVAFLADAGLSGPVLDVGCGNGYAVLEWRRRGVRAIGVDSSAYRMFRWIDERTALPLVVADATLLNPTFRQIRRYASDRAVTVLPLRDRLAFRQVSRKWWGRLLRLPAALFVRILDLVPRRMQTVLAVLYPFLVVRIEPGSPRSRDGVTVQR